MYNNDYNVTTSPTWVGVGNQPNKQELETTIEAMVANQETEIFMLLVASSLHPAIYYQQLKDTRTLISSIKEGK